LPFVLEQINDIKSLFEAKNFVEAELVIKQALEQHPNMPELLNLLAETKLHLGEREAAKQILLDIIAQWPNHKDALNNLAVVLSYEMKFDSAIQLLQDVLQLYPSCPIAYENLEFLQNEKNSLIPNPVSTDRPNPIHLWNDDVRFNCILKQITEHSLVDKLRCYMLYQLAKQVLRLPGDVAEIGVYKGGTARLLAKSFEAPGKIVHLFDTFSGMPPTDPDRDLHKEGDFNDTSLETVSSFLHDCPNVKFYEGLFPVTAKPVKNYKFCLVHIDVDIYTSVLDCCKFFYPRMFRGGIMVFDDYGFISCPGAKRAVDEFFLRKPETPCYLPTGQCFVVRL
jgi:O-methyltransferase